MCFHFWCLVPKHSSGSLQRPLCLMLCFCSYLCWTKLIRRRCSFPECRGTEERVVSKCSRCYCRGMWNVFSVRPWVFGPSTLAVWKKYNKNKGSLQRKTGPAWRGKGCVVICWVQATGPGLQLGKLRRNGELVADLDVSFCQETNPFSN